MYVLRVIEDNGWDHDDDCPNAQPGTEVCVGLPRKGVLNEQSPEQQRKRRPYALDTGAQNETMHH